MKNILKILPEKIKEEILKYNCTENITEIRLRNSKYMYIYYGIKEVKTNIKIEKQHLITILKNASLNSIYSVQQDLNNGYITITGGHRIGLVGEAILQDSKIINIKNIYSLNIRVAKEYIGISDSIINKINVNINKKKLLNTLIISPPLCGKTTLLRDIVRNISNNGYNTVVVDERGEIASVYNGEATLDIGDRTDVISYVPKDIGMQMAVRSMAPDVVCTDEIGTVEDIAAIKYLARTGVKFITTMHGNSLQDVLFTDMKELIDKGYIDLAIVLSKREGIGTIEEIYNLKDEAKHM